MDNTDTIEAVASVFNDEQWDRLVEHTNELGPISDEEYHGASANGSFLSSGKLRSFRDGPAIYRAEIDGTIPRKDSDAFLVGRALHTLVLEGLDVFGARYAIGGPINPRTGEPFGRNTKAFADWRDGEARGREVLTETDAELVREMAAAIRLHALAASLLADDPPTLNEAVFRWDETRWKDTIACQIKCDAISKHCGLIDIKTTTKLEDFERSARKYGYAAQAAFYRSGLAHVAGCAPSRIDCTFIVVEKTAPWRCGVWCLDADTLLVEDEENARAIDRLARCRAKNEWPSGYEAARTLCI